MEEENAKKTEKLICGTATNCSDSYGCGITLQLPWFLPYGRRIYVD